MNSVKQYSTTQILRFIGTAALLLSGAIFLYQGMNLHGGVERFLGFGSFVITLALAGVYCVKKLKEPKGGRAFMSIAVAGVAALSAQLGGVIYDVLIPNNIALPKVFLTPLNGPLGGPLGAGLCTALLFLVGLPLTKMGFRILTREYHEPLSKAFMLGCLTMLMPFRDNLMPFFSVGVIGYVAVALLKKSNFFKVPNHTRETQIGLALVATPLAIIMGRSVFYLDTSLVTMLISATASALCMAAVLFKQENVSLDKSPTTQKQIYTWSSFAGFFAMIAWFGFYAEVDKFFRPLPDLPELVLALVPAYLLVRGAHIIAGHKTSFLRNTVLWIAASWIMGYTLGASFWWVHLSLAVGALLTVDAYKNKLQQEFYAGTALVGVAAIKLIYEIIDHIHLSGWLPLAIVGTVVILVASQLESQSETMKRRWIDLKGHFQ